MTIQIEQIDASRLVEYATIPMAFEVRSILRVEPVQHGLGGVAFREETVANPYVKDFTAVGEGGPETWPSRFDVTGWGIFVAYRASKLVGGVAVATPHEEILVTQGRTDTAALWDIRVTPSERRNGIGMRLLRHGADWARARGFRFLGIETMNVNVPACRLYAKAGAELSEIRRFAYETCPEVADESMIIWRMRL